LESNRGFAGDGLPKAAGWDWSLGGGADDQWLKGLRRMGMRHGRSARPLARTPGFMAVEALLGMAAEANANAHKRRRRGRQDPEKALQK